MRGTTVSKNQNILRKQDETVSEAAVRRGVSEVMEVATEGERPGPDRPRR